MQQLGPVDHKNEEEQEQDQRNGRGLNIFWIPLSFLVTWEYLRRVMGRRVRIRLDSLLKYWMSVKSVKWSITLNVIHQCSMAGEGRKIV